MKKLIFGFILLGTFVAHADRVTGGSSTDFGGGSGTRGGGFGQELMVDKVRPLDPLCVARTDGKGITIEYSCRPVTRAQADYLNQLDEQMQASMGSRCLQVTTDGTGRRVTINEGCDQMRELTELKP